MKMLKKLFPKFLSICIIFGTTTLLLLGNPSEGVDLPGNSIVFSDVDASSPAVADLNRGSNPMPFRIDNSWHENPEHGISCNNISKIVSSCFLQKGECFLKTAGK